MIKVQHFIKYLKRNFGIKITKSAYSSYNGCFFSPKDFKPKELFNGFIGEDFKGGAIHKRAGK